MTMGCFSAACYSAALVLVRKAPSSHGQLGSLQPFRSGKFELAPVERQKYFRPQQQR